MAPITAPEDLACSAELYDAVCNLEGVRSMKHWGVSCAICWRVRKAVIFQGRLPDSAMLAESVVHDGQSYGGYAVSGRSGGYNWGDRMRLAALARLTGRLLRARVESERRAREFDLIAAQLRQQAQILDQIQESVITMDLAGFYRQLEQGCRTTFSVTPPMKRSVATSFFCTRIRTTRTTAAPSLIPTFCSKVAAR
ncbi:hypothetical protein ACFS07_13965 [Undibacterium arcticum]